ncbi:MAG: hypothetical protein E4G99_13060 [Anaerolineales bacterium]|nr:MAG: hypothetical protein E4G99_13060 [Anaerolineales bacterium]
MPLFDYERSLPLDSNEQNRWAEGRSIWSDFTYASPLGGRVPALLGMPKEKGPFPAILMLHGSEGDCRLFHHPG